MALHISIAAETLFHLGPVAITNSIFTSWLVSILIILVALKFHYSTKSETKPTGLQNLLEMIVEAFENLCNSITQSRLKTAVIIPIPFAAFCWILLNNWFGLLPGVGTLGLTEPTEPPQAASPFSVYAKETEGTSAESATTKFVPIFRAGTADLNTTLALALVSVGATQVIGVKFVGRSYWTKFFNLKGIFSFVGLLEFVSELSKIVSFAFRLFGNIFAGEVLLTVIMFLVPILVPVPFIGLEFFVGIIQALVFAMLTIVFMNIASAHQGEH
ncbi:ATP synthase F0 subunit A [Microgenomates group bacterium RBG_16_45_19]|nr:MAG: ATP synthase F0 subunit A [Microgenomates group bacterium RBG_16_45_19]